MTHDFAETVSLTRPLAAGEHRCRCDGPGCRCRPDRDANLDRELDDLVERCLCRLLATLPPELAEVLWRAEIEGQCASCIARCLGIDPRTARSRLHSARIAVLGRLQPWARTYLESGCPSAKH